MIHEVILPKLGQTVEEGSIVEWVKQEGDPVQRGDILFTTETDKAVLDVEATARGFLRRIIVPAGVTVPVLTVVGLITRSADEDVSDWHAMSTEAPSAQPEVDTGATTPAPSEAPEEDEERTRIFASPRARRVAREKDVDLTLVTGSGPNGRIVERDILAYLESLPDATPVAQRLAEHAGIDLRTLRGSRPDGRITKADVERAIEAQQETILPAPEAAPPSAVTTPMGSAPLSGVRAVIARRMYESHQLTAPVTLTTEVDATAFVALRERMKAELEEKFGFRVGYNDLLIKMVAQALREFPYMNVQMGDEVILQLEDVHVALAIDTDRGLLVPVVRDADRKSLSEIGREVRDLVQRARSGKALPDELSGSTFTITNLGMFDVDAFTPLINLPETAILGVGRIKDRPAVVAGELCVRKLMWLSLTFDHRLVDGAPAARFLQHLKNLIEDPTQWLVACLG